MENQRYVVYDTWNEEISNKHKAVSIEAEEARRNAAAKEAERRLKAPNYADYGDFYFLAYDDAFFEQLKGADLLRILYLASYMQYSSKGYILKVTNKMLNKQDCQAYLCLGKTAFHEFWKRCASLGIVKEDEGGHVVLSEAYFYKGTLTKKIRNRYQKMIRINIAAVRALYKTNDDNGHKKLAYLYQLIPYTETENNAVRVWSSADQEEKYPTAAQISEILGCDMRTWRRLKKWYAEICVEHKGKAQPLARTFQNSQNENIIIINPNLFYAGDSYKKVLELIDISST